MADKPTTIVEEVQRQQKKNYYDLSIPLFDDLPQLHLTELKEKTKVVKRHADYLDEIRQEFCCIPRSSWWKGW